MAYTYREDRFHLLLTEADWGHPKAPLCWDEARACLTLQPFLARAPQRAGAIEGRRGVARSSSGALWWVSGDGRQIKVAGPGAVEARVFWPVPEAADGVAPPAGAFGPVGTGDAVPVELCGLAVTTEEYLVAGLPGQQALLCCDLLSGANPVLLRWPQPLAIVDMASARGGGLVILEGGETPRLWWLDRNLRIQGEPVPLPAAHPVALELLPDGSPLVLTGEPDMLYRLRNGQWEQAPLTGPDDKPLQPYDFAFQPDPEPGAAAGRGAMGGALYVATRQDAQVFAFRLKAEPGALSAALQLAYLPVYKSRGWGLLAAGGQIWYDSDGSWTQLTEEQEPRYAESGELTTEPEQMDGKEADCVWHRIFLDASIPPGTAVRIATRAVDDLSRPDQHPWQEEPTPYLRPDGRELPYVPPYTDGDAAYTGTWELLLQRARGRYLQLRIRLTGTGRASPRIHALRVAYPRFSYLTNYLPTAFQNDPASASFLDRFLANPEGVMTEMEQGVADMHLLFNPRTAPPEYLDWLADWLGLVLDERWEERRCRLLIAGAMELFRSRGTLPGLVRAIRLATDPVPTEAIFTTDIRPYTGYGSGPRRTPFRVAEEFDGSHRFTIYLAADPRVPPLDPDLVRQVVELERPAHTQYEIKPEWAAFRVDSARVGLETILSESGRLAGLVLGQGALGETCLAASPPWDVPGRYSAGREQIGPGNERISSKGGPQHGNIRTGWADLEGAGPV